jgi:hypothetical protein
VVGAGDTVTPPEDNAVFAARHVPDAELLLIRGAAGHEIFVNLCNADGKAELTEACVDPPEVDRGLIHAEVAAAALRFFDRNLGVARPD